jgi:hypothetical protein
MHDAAQKLDFARSLRDLTASSAADTTGSEHLVARHAELLAIRRWVCH